MSVTIGDACYKVAAFDSSSAILGRLSARVLRGIKDGESLSSAIDDGLRSTLGLDLSSPSCQVMVGDSVATRNGIVSVGGDRGEFISADDVEELVGILGLREKITEARKDKKHEKKTDLNLMIEHLDDWVRVSLGTVLEKLTGDGCDSILEGINYLGDHVKAQPAPLDVRKLACSVTGQDSFSDVTTKVMVEESLALRAYVDVQRDLEHETDRRMFVRDQIAALYLRLTGEQPDGMSSAVMLSKMQEVLGETPEF